MQSGIRSGLRSGVRSGLNPSADEASWTEDATSGKGAPADATEWGAVAAAAGMESPSSGWGMQEASGSLADSIGARTLASNGTPGYQQSVTGWTRKAVRLDDNSTDWFSTTIPAANTTSFLGLFYVAITATPSNVRTLIEHPNVFANVRNTGLYQASGGSNVDGSVPIGTSVRPVLIYSNVDTGELSVITDAEYITAAAFTDPGTAFKLGGTGATPSPPALILLGAAWTGADAEVTDDQIRDLLEALGWTVAW